MNTTSTAPVKTYERTAQEERAHNIQINGEKPLVEITGTNTYPIANLLRVFGGKWNKETKTWWVPDHKFNEAQTAADEQTKKQAERDAAKLAKASQPAAKPVAKAKAPEVVKAKPAVVITTAQVVAAAAPAPTDRIVFRINNLLSAATDLAAAATDPATVESLKLAIDALTLAGQNAVAAATK